MRREKSLIASAPPWVNVVLAPAQRANPLVSAMTPDEEFEQMLGTPGGVPEVPRCFESFAGDLLGRHVPDEASERIGDRAPGVAHPAAKGRTSDRIPGEPVISFTSAAIAVWASDRR